MQQQTEADRRLLRELIRDLIVDARTSTGEYRDNCLKQIRHLFTNRRHIRLDQFGWPTN